MSDPTWLPDVLRAEGLACDIYPGAMDRGHGDFGQITHVICHHTGSFGETPRGIAEHPSLGLASQLYLGRDGKYTLCGVGIAWHAGQGSWPGIPANNANQFTIGIEAANDGGGTPGEPHRASWSDAQYDAYVRGVAAILRHLKLDSSRAIGHKEWAGPAQGKWDPGAIDMNVFRRDVQAAIEGRYPGQKSTDPIDPILKEPNAMDMLKRIFFELTYKFTSRVPGSKYTDTLAGFILNTDRATYETDKKVSAVAAQLNTVETKLDQLIASHNQNKES